jgi:hypothetical protein
MERPGARYNQVVRGVKSHDRIRRFGFNLPGPACTDERFRRLRFALLA